MARPKRINQIDLRNEIKTTAWQQIAENGAPSLALRAIARALQITAPAIYNYYPSRDELVTALIIDAYTSMGEAQTAALVSLPEHDHPARLIALAQAYRQWALTYPQRYQLIFGTPIPGYHAPENLTDATAVDSLLPLINCLNAAQQDGQLRSMPKDMLSDVLRRQLEMWRFVYPVGHVYVFYSAIVFWSRAHGLVSLEISHQYPPFVQDIESLYRIEMNRLVKEYLLVE
jgi:AcrR family transcriptional regulator